MYSSCDRRPRRGVIQLHSIKRAAGAVLEDVGVDHCRRHVAVPEELLHCGGVVASLEQMRGEGMPEGVAGCPLFHPGFRRGTRHGPLHHRLVQMMPALAALTIAPT